MTLLSMAVVLVIGAVVAFAYALLQPELASLRSEQMKQEMRVDGKRVKESTPVLDGIDRALSSVGWKPFTEDELALAGMKSTPTSMVATTLLIALVVLGAVQMLTGNLLLALLCGVAVPFVVKRVVAAKTDRRRAKFERQLPEAVTMLSSALKSGMNVPTALANVAQEVEAPMGEELARVVNESRLGRDLVVGMRDTSARMHSQDFLWITEAVAIQRESGGRLSEILDRVISTIAERNELKEKTRALAAEGKMSGYVLMALPVLIGGGYAVVNPEYMTPLFTTGPGLVLSAAAVTLYIVGGVWLGRITKVNL